MAAPFFYFAAPAADALEPEEGPRDRPNEVVVRGAHFFGTSSLAAGWARSTRQRRTFRLPRCAARRRWCRGVVSDLRVTLNGGADYTAPLTFTLLAPAPVATVAFSPPAAR